MRSWRDVFPGILAIVFYVIHAAWVARDHQLEDLLWSCHVANLLCGVGILARRALPNAIGFLWLALGVPLWLLDLAMGGTFILTSPLTHLGGLAVAATGVRRLGFPVGSWWKALGALFLLQQLCRFVTPARANVNLAFGVWTGWESRFPSYAIYWSLLFAASAALFFLMELATRRVLRTSPGVA